MNLNDFLKKYCKNCKENCDKGLIERETFIRCVDRDIYEEKNGEENSEEKEK